LKWIDGLAKDDLPEYVAPLKEALKQVSIAVEKRLDRFLPLTGGDERTVIEAMRYAMFAGGKRLRPFLVVVTADLFGVDKKRALNVAAALECVHCYSLIHDDLPAMDDDDIRRGQPTTHMEYDEATAILAGDALQALAFEILSSDETHQDARVRIELVEKLAKAMGAHGMVGGQMADIMAEGRDLSMGEITHLQNLKTGALIHYAVEAGAILGKAGDHQRHMLEAYARDLGLAFQIVDDLLDASGDPEKVGKAVGKDQANGKATFVSILGEDRARQQAEILVTQAIEHLSDFGPRALLLEGLARFVLDRQK